MRIVAAIALGLALAGCVPGAPADDPAIGTIHVVNDSDRAVMAIVGSLLDGNTPIAARPCGGTTDLEVGEADIESDGRLMAALAIDPGGGLDVALRAHDGDPAGLDGDFTASPIWSDGTLAGRLPLYLVVAPDLTVTVSSTPVAPSAAGCVPAF